MPSRNRPHFQLKSQPGEVHALYQSEDIIGSHCAQLGGTGDRALEPSEVEIVQAELTCVPCLGLHWSETPGAEEAWLEANGHDKKLAWERDSPAPQIDRREMY